jgi:hypothetical protein
MPTTAPLPVRSRPGRPPKFGRAARAVALTLPEDVIAALGRLDDDLARAVVRLSQPLVADRGHHPSVELTQYHGQAVIVIPPIRTLESIPGVTLVPLPDGRTLISLDGSLSVSDFELKLLYALDADKGLPEPDRTAMSSIAQILRHARQTRGISIHERSIIVLKVSRGRRTASTPARRRKTRTPTPQRIRPAGAQQRTIRESTDKAPGPRVSR